jgi:hypothetical protein
MAEKPRAIDHPASDHVEKMSGDVGITQTETLQIDSVEIRRLLRKIDLRLLPLLTVLYVLSFMGTLFIAAGVLALYDFD